METLWSLQYLIDCQNWGRGLFFIGCFMVEKGSPSTGRRQKWIVTRSSISDAGREISACRKERVLCFWVEQLLWFLWGTRCMEDFRKNQRSGRFGSSFLEARRRNLRFLDALLLKCMLVNLLRYILHKAVWQWRIHLCMLMREPPGRIVASEGQSFRKFATVKVSCKSSQVNRCCDFLWSSLIWEENSLSFIYSWKVGLVKLFGYLTTPYRAE